MLWTAGRERVWHGRAYLVLPSFPWVTAAPALRDGRSWLGVGAPGSDGAGAGWQQGDGEDDLPVLLFEDGKDGKMWVKCCHCLFKPA